MSNWPMSEWAMFEWSAVLRTGVTGATGSGAAVMGTVNVTPDSFSDGGRFLDPEAAIAHGLELVAAGADLLDVGGESTRPGAEPVDDAEERRRVLPVIEALAARAGVPVSIDTTKAAVAEAALRAGARVVNDISAGRHDPDLLGVVAQHGAGYIAMHMQGEPRTMQDAPHYDDVVREVGDFLAERAEVARAAGIGAGALALDPGIGFGKTVAHNLDLLAHLDALVAHLDAPIVVGASRKRFLAALLGDAGVPDTTERRDDCTLATTVWATGLGARVVRVHDVRSAARAVALYDVMARAEAA
jgi:dihydropteroate synthase